MSEVRSTEARATTYRSRMRRDMARQIGIHLLDLDTGTQATVIDEAVNEAMFYVEHLLVEIETLRQQLAAGDQITYLDGSGP